MAVEVTCALVLCSTLKLASFIAFTFVCAHWLACGMYLITSLEAGQVLVATSILSTVTIWIFGTAVTQFLVSAAEDVAGGIQ